MASITTWTRLEPRARGDDLRPSLEARVHDPAWLLGRQWQLGEFVGEDAGSPVHLSLSVRAAPLTAARIGGREGAVDPGPPLDALAGAERRRAWADAGGEESHLPGPSLAERVESGAELLHLLADAGCSALGIAALTGPYPLPAPSPGAATDEGASMLALAAGRLPDGAALAPVLEEIARSGDASHLLALPEGDRAAVVSAAVEWVAWRAALVHGTESAAWVDERLEHRFELAADPVDGPPIALTSPAWDGDRLDWYDVDVDLDAAPPARPAGSPAPTPLPGVHPATGTVSATGLPAPLAYPGMPAPRWWQFEDANVNFAEVTADREDIARMLVVEFAGVYSNDWYLWPLELPVGALHTIRRLTVTTTFADEVAADTVEVGAAPVEGAEGDVEWQLFRPTAHGGAGDAAAYAGLLLLPTLASPVDGEVVEEVRYLRDETANLAWAVEATVRGEDGLPLDRHAAAAAAGTLPAAAPDAGSGDDLGPLQWRFQTEVPPHWFPLAPDADGLPLFRRLMMRRVDEKGQVRTVRPAGEILSPEGQWIFREEVPRDGARVIRRHRMARGTDGRLYAWSARRAETGRGEGSSGLRYDETLPLAPEPQP